MTKPITGAKIQQIVADLPSNCPTRPVPSNICAIFKTH
jgi:hypothetical protein